MIDDTPSPHGAANRRENFRIDTVLPVSLRKVEGGVVPTAHIVPVTANPANSEIWEGGLNASFGAFDSNFALLLIEVNGKLDRLLEAEHLNSKEAEGTDTSKLSLSQLLLQVNLKLDYLLNARHLSRQEERVILDMVSLSASGIKVKSYEPLLAGDLVEVRILLTINKPFWLVAGGSVVRTFPLSKGLSEVSIRFHNLSEMVSDEISRYALLDQKKQILARRGALSS